MKKFFHLPRWNLFRTKKSRPFSAYFCCKKLQNEGSLWVYFDLNLTQWLSQFFQESQKKFKWIRTYFVRIVTKQERLLRASFFLCDVIVLIYPKNGSKLAHYLIQNESGIGKKHLPGTLKFENLQRSGRKSYKKTSCKIFF